MIEFITLL